MQMVKMLGKHSSDRIVRKYYRIMLEVYNDGCGILLAGD